MENQHLWSVPNTGNCIKYMVGIGIKGNLIRCKERPINEPLVAELHKQLVQMEESVVISNGLTILLLVQKLLDKNYD